MFVAKQTSMVVKTTQAVVKMTSGVVKNDSGGGPLVAKTTLVVIKTTQEWSKQLPADLQRKEAAGHHSASKNKTRAGLPACKLSVFSKVTV